MPGRAPKHVTKIIHECSTLEDAIVSTGFGSFHYRLILVCGFCFLSAGFQTGVNAYVIPAAKCDLKMTSAQMGALSAVFLAGSICSCYLWGMVADCIGRKKVLVISFITDAILGFASSLSQTYYSFFIFRFLNGFIISCPSSLTLLYLGEFHTAGRSSRSICFVGFFWTLSWMLLPGISWLILPQAWNMEFQGYFFHTWQVLIVLLSFTSFISALLLMFFPESPKFLLSQGLQEKALEVLRRMYTGNTHFPSDMFPVKTFKHSMEIRVGTNTPKSISYILLTLQSQTKSLFKAPALKRNILCASITFANMFGFFGFGLWLPELFNRFENHNKLNVNKPVSVCELSRYNLTLDTFFIRSSNSHNTFEHIRDDVIKKLIRNMVSEDFTSETCSSVVDEKVFFNTVIVGSACLLTNFISAVVTGIFPQKVLPVATMLVAGCCSIIIYFISSSLQILIVTCIFQSTIAAANFLIAGVTVAVFPTHIRGIAVSFAVFCGRIGGALSTLMLGLLLDVSCEVPMFLMSSVIIGGGLLCLLIPEVQHQ